MILFFNTHATMIFNEISFHLYIFLIIFSLRFLICVLITIRIADCMTVALCGVGAELCRSVDALLKMIETWHGGKLRVGGYAAISNA